jgi:type III pantothenate kinase
MVIAFDLGNTALTIGVYDHDRLKHRFFTTADLTRTSDEYRIIIQSFMETTPYNDQDCEAIVFSCVVPPLAQIVKQAIAALFAAPILTVGRKVKTGLALHVDHPSEVGADLVSAGVGGIHKYQAPLVIVDLGTATKIIAIDGSGAFVGVTIAPGLMVSLQALIGRASLLPEVDLELPLRVIGRNTSDAINSGTLYGHTALVQGLTEQVQKELGTDKPAILTGGYAKHLQSLLPQFIYDENLLLDGLYQIYLKNRGFKK